MVEKKSFGPLSAALAIVLASATAGHPSSHREAPAISQDPTVDNTDVYFFRDPVDPSMVVIIANYVGLEQPAAGPNFNRFADDARYEIHVDNDGDVEDDVTFRFEFTTTFANPGTFLYNTGPIAAPNADPQNVRQTFRLTKISNAGTKVLLGSAPTPPVNVGPRSTPAYNRNLAKPTITALPGGGRVFAGQRKDAFYVDLGSIFDLGALRPLESLHVIPNPQTPPVDGLDMMNVHSIALQVPITSLLAPGANPACAASAAALDDPSCVLGVYASASRRRTRTLDPNGGAPTGAGEFVQVSRLGFPLVNEVLIPLGQKDRWNSRDPRNDLDPDGFGAFIVDPELARLLPVLYPAVFNGTNVPPAPRGDIVAVLSGAGQGLSPANYLPPADLLRLNVSTPITPRESRRSDGLLGGDADGFPNGRRIEDDVVDVAIQVVAGVLAAGFGNGNPASLIPGTAAPYAVLGDGVEFDDESPLRKKFPYLPKPLSGYDQAATNP